MRAIFPALSWLSLTSAMWAQQSFVPLVVGTPGTPSSTLYGTYGGALLRSQDLGKTWLPLYINPAGSPQPPINGFAVDPYSANTVYLATTAAAGTFWKSVDGGQTWSQAAGGLPVTGPGIDYFKAFQDTTTYLYIKIGGNLYRSADNAQTWILQSHLPGSDGSFAIAESQRSRMYYIDAVSLSVYFTSDEGIGWMATQQVLGASPPAGVSIVGFGVPYFDPSDVYVTLNIPATGIVAYASLDGSAFMDQTSVGLNSFTQIISASTGPVYALTNPAQGFYRTTNSGQTWQPLGSTGLAHYGMTAVDPMVRSTIYGVETVQPSATPVALVQSTDSGNTWATIPATITPSIGQPVPMINVTLEQGAPYSVSFNVRTAESPVWQTPVTLSASAGASWIQLGAASGTTPLAESITISSAGLLPGTYSSAIAISAPQTFNKTVTVPVQLTVRPLGSLGPGYSVMTVVGSGSPAGTVTAGTPLNVAVGDARALAFDPSGNVDISAGNRIWQFTPATSTASAGLTALVGNGTNGSNGDGNAPLTASISDPDAIAFDSTGAMYFTEFAHERVRKLSGYTPPNIGTLSTALDMTLNNQPAGPQPVGSHTLVLDPAKFMFLTTPSGIVNYQNARLQLSILDTFSNPYAMIEDASGNLYVSDMGLNQILEITAAGVQSVFAGTGAQGFGGDGGAATQALLNAPAGIAFDSQGVLYVADSGNNRIRTITPDGNIHTIAGSGLPGFVGDGSTADFASFMGPLGVIVDSSGNVYVADTGNNRVRVLTPQSTPTPRIQKIQGPNEATQLAPGAIFSLYGSLLAAPNYQFLVTSATWPRDAPANATGPGAVSVAINGVAAPLYFVGPGQINGQIPYETALGPATAIVTVNGSLPAHINFQVVAAAPDVLVQNGVTQQAVAQNASEGLSINSPTTPAHPGDVEVVYLSGIGVSNPPVATAASAPTTPPLAVVSYPYQITLNGQPVPSSCQYNFLGYAPGYTALVQADFCLPANLTGDLSLVVTVNGVSSPPTILSVR